jgi:hypothetical protein
MFIKILRWIGVIPGAVLAFYGIYTLNKLSLYFFASPESTFTKMIIEVIISGTSGCMAVVIGSLISPSYRKYTSILLMTILVIITIISFAQYVKIGDYLLGGIYCIATLLGGTYGCYEIITNKDLKLSDIASS